MPIKDYTLKNKRNYKLNEKQNEIVEALIEHDYFFNCAQTGLGKTFTTVTAAIHRMIKEKDEEIHYVIIAPTSAIKAFNDTISKILGLQIDMNTAVLTNIAEAARFHLFNYSTLSKGITNDKIKKGVSLKNVNPYLHKLFELYKQHDRLHLIIDEAHALQNPKTSQYRVVKAIRPLFKSIWALTATPLLNNLEGFYNMVDMIIPGFFGNWYSFRRRYEVLEKREIWTSTKKRVNGKIKSVPKKKIVYETVGYKREEELQNVFSAISIIKAIDYNVVFKYKKVKLSKKMRKFYEMASDGLLASTEGSLEHKGARLHDLQRVVSNSHEHFKATENKKITDKELLLLQTIKEVLDRDEAMLIYFSYKPTLARVKYMLEYVRKKFGIGNIYEISGDIKQSERRKVEAAINRKDIVLITSAGTESINLQKANNLIFYEIPFPVREFIQACGRITRTDTLYDEFGIYVLEAEGTIDTYKRKKIEKHADFIKSVVGNNGGVLPTQYLSIALEDKSAMKDAYLWCKD